MNRFVRLSLAAALTLPLLSSCGLRGDLERPEPLFEEKEETVEEPEEVASNTVVTSRTVIRRNAEGGIIPNASPSTPVSEGGLAEIE